MGEPGFLHAFSLIDVDNDGVISIQDLEDYSKKGTVTDDFVTKWRNIFDKDNTGQITFLHFCEVLGVSKKKRNQILRERKITTWNLTPKPIVYSTNLDAEMQKRIVAILEANWNESSVDSSLFDITVHCDREFGPCWRARMVEGTDPVDEAINTKHMVFSCDEGTTKGCIWLEKETKNRPGGCCCC
ncbi:unnamed protein product [Trichobilharzia szidati]|nr:unnamed protein product [Trichobilharzia szidati]